MAKKSRYISDLASTFKVLGDSTRLRLLMILRDGEFNVTALKKKLRLPQPSVSHHLAILRRGGLVQASRCGKEIYYSLADLAEGKTARSLQSWLDKSKAVQVGPFVMGLSKR